MLPVLLSTVPQQDRLQAGLLAPRAHLQPHVWWQWQPMDAAPLWTRRLAVLVPWEGRYRVFHDTHLKREPHRLHVRPLFTQRPVHSIILPRKCSGLGSDEQLLHWPGFTDQLQRLLLRLLGLRGKFWETFREEPVRWCRCRLASTPVTVRRDDWWWLGEYTNVCTACRERMQWLISSDECVDIRVIELHTGPKCCFKSVPGTRSCKWTWNALHQIMSQPRAEEEREVAWHTLVM